MQQRGSDINTLSNFVGSLKFPIAGILKSFTGTESNVIYPMVEEHLLAINIPPLK